MTEIYDKKLNHLLWRFHAFILDTALPQAMNCLTLLGQTIAAHTTHQHCIQPVHETDFTTKAVKNLAGTRTHYSTSVLHFDPAEAQDHKFHQWITWDKPSEDTRGYSWIPVSLYTCIKWSMYRWKGVWVCFSFLQFVIIYRKFIIFLQIIWLHIRLK